MRENDDDDASALGIHVYASVLHQAFATSASVSGGGGGGGGSTSSLKATSTAHIDHLLRAITPRIIEYLFASLEQPEDGASGGRRRRSRSGSDMSTTSERFNDKKLAVCRCLPLIINILHASLPSKRLVDMTLVLDWSVALLATGQFDQRPDIKLELVRAYTSMLEHCGDRAALKIAIASRKFFAALLDQLRSVTTSPQLPPTPHDQDQDQDNNMFVHEFVRVCLSLIKTLLHNSQSVKDIFDNECHAYDALYHILRRTSCLDMQITAILIDMISESSASSLSVSSGANVVEFENCAMVGLLIKLTPFMHELAQHVAVDNVCQMCILNTRNKLKACEHSLLLHLIQALGHHAKFSKVSIQKLFDTIQTLGRCSLRPNELFHLMELLRPANRFPYGIQVLRCFVLWAKHTTMLGLNANLLSFHNQVDGGGGGGGGGGADGAIGGRGATGGGGGGGHSGSGSHRGTVMVGGGGAGSFSADSSLASYSTSANESSSESTSTSLTVTASSGVATSSGNQSSSATTGVSS